MPTDSARRWSTQAALSTRAVALTVPVAAKASPQDISIERAGSPVRTPRSQPCEGQLFGDEPWLDTTTQSVNQRKQGGGLLSEDRQEVSYPLELHYVGIGCSTDW